MTVGIRNFPKQVLDALARSVRAVKALRGQPDGFVATDQTGYAVPEQLGSGSPSSTTVLRGDQTWGSSATSIPDDDYFDIEISGGGTIYTVESYGDVIVVPVGDDLQDVIDTFSGGAHVIQLGRGDYYGDSGSPSTPITIPNTAGNVQIKGLGVDDTTILSPILCETGRFGLVDVAVKPDGTAYGVKIFKSGSFTSRCYFERAWIGASSSGAGDGPVLGLVLDGAGVLLASNLTIAFCTSHGLLVDSTAAEPNTTLKFDMCSFVQNEGYGIRLLNACSIAEFNGGNSEGNVSGEAYAESVNNVRFRDFDFESFTETFDQQVHLVSCNPVLFDNCSFSATGANVTRAVLGQSVGGCHMFSNRFAGWTDVGIIRMDSASSLCHIHDNIISDGCWVEDYSR